MSVPCKGLAHNVDNYFFHQIILQSNFASLNMISYKMQLNVEMFHFHVINGVVRQFDHTLIVAIYCSELKI